MPKYLIEMSRRFIQDEIATFTVEAASKTEARRLAKARAGVDNEIEWEASDTEYRDYAVDDVVAQ